MVSLGQSFLLQGGLAAPAASQRDIGPFVFLPPCRHSGATSIVKVYTAAIQLLAAYSQPKYLYGAPGVDANDALYAASNKFLGETSKLGATLLAQCVQHLSAMDKSVSERSTLAFGLFERCEVAEAGMRFGVVAFSSRCRCGGALLTLWCIFPLGSMLFNQAAFYGRLDQQSKSQHSDGALDLGTQRQCEHGRDGELLVCAGWAGSSVCVSLSVSLFCVLTVPFCDCTETRGAVSKEGGQPARRRRGAGSLCVRFFKASAVKPLCSCYLRLAFKPSLRGRVKQKQNGCNDLTQK